MEPTYLRAKACDLLLEHSDALLVLVPLSVVSLVSVPRMFLSSLAQLPLLAPYPDLPGSVTCPFFPLRRLEPGHRLGRVLK